MGFGGETFQARPRGGCEDVGGRRPVEKLLRSWPSAEEGEGHTWGHTDDFGFNCRCAEGGARAAPGICDPTGPLLLLRPSMAVLPTHLVHEGAHKVNEANLQFGELSCLVPVHHRLWGWGGAQ